ncbi:DUF6232 family protein [Streptomyces sp. NPDC004779]
MPRGPRAIELRVSRGVLWIGRAAMPLRHVTSVEVSRLKPDWALRVLVLVAAAVGAGYLGKAAATVDGFPLVLLALIAAAAYLLKILFGPPRPVLIVQTAGGSTAAVTLPDVDDLRWIADMIVGAIDDVPGEFTCVVQRLGQGEQNGPVVRTGGGKGLSYR